MREQTLKKQLRELKRVRTAVITGERTDITEDQVNNRIEAVRELLGTQKERIEAIKLEFGEKEYLRLFVDYADVIKRIAAGETVSNIAIGFGVQRESLVGWLKEKGEIKMAKASTKLTVDIFKKLSGKGLKAAEIAKETGVSVATVYAKKSEWKKAGLLGDAQPTKKATTVAVASKPIAEQVPVPTQTQTDSVDYKAKYTYQQQTLEALQKSVVEYQESAKIANGAAKEVKERSNRLRDELVNAQNDLRAEINKNIELQEKAQGYEKRAEELEEQLLAERAEIERLRAELKHAKHQAHQNAAPTESVMVARLESELAEMATEVGNAGYEAAHWERKYKQLAKMSGPILKDWVTDLLKEVE